MMPRVDWRKRATKRERQGNVGSGKKGGEMKLQRGSERIQRNNWWANGGQQIAKTKREEIRRRRGGGSNRP